MTDIDISLLEKFILASSKQEVIKELPPFSQSSLFLSLLCQFHNQTLTNEQLDDQVREFLRKGSFDYSYKAIVEFHNYLRNIQLKKNDPSALKVILEDFNKKYFNYNFNYMNPSNSGQASKLEGEYKQEKISELKPEDIHSFEIDSALQKLYISKTIESLDKISYDYLHLIDLDKFDQERDYNVLQRMFANIPSFHNMPKILDFCIKVKLNTKYTLPIIEQFIWNKLELSQQYALLKQFPSSFDQAFIQKFIEEFFESSLIDSSKLTTAEKNIKLTEILNFTKILPVKYQRLHSYYFFKSLSIQASMNMFDEAMFIEYLNNPYQISQNFLYEYKQGLEKHAQVHCIQHLDMGISVNDENELYQTFLKHFFAEGKGYEHFKPFFDNVFLKKLYYTVQLNEGRISDEAKNALSTSELDSLSQTKILNLFQNKPVFKANEPVSLSIEVKNISKLIVRVFEVNTVNYLKSHMSKTYEDIDVSGLIPSEQYQYTYTQPSIVIHKEAYNFQNITLRERGVFIIDFIGEELNSRALICKGGLSLIYDSITGRNCAIIDEYGQVCKGQSTGIFIANTFFETNQDGHISIPLNIRDQNTEVMITHENFADLSRIVVQTPALQLQSNLLYNKETFITGNKVEVLFQLKLLLNNVPITLERLQNATVSLTSVNDKGVESKMDFKNLALSDDKDLPIFFIFPLKAQSLLFEFKADYKLIDETKTLTSSQSIRLERQQENVIAQGLFKKDNDGVLYYEVVGRNGEKIPNVSVSLNITVKCLQAAQQFTLDTNDKGKIKLGKIKDLKSVDASSYFGSNVYFEPENAEEHYPLFVDMLENEQMPFLVPQTTKDVYLFSLGQSGQKKENITEKNTRRVNDQLMIERLLAGRYQLLIRGFTMTIIVHKGDYFPFNGPNIKTKDYVQAIPKINETLICDFKRQEDGFEVNVHSDSKKLRAHLMTYNYIYDEEIMLLTNLKNFTQKGIGSNENSCFQLNKPANVYKSGKRLHDEIIYVYDRKTKQTFMGNTLEKPGMILVRNRVKETTESDQVVNQGNDFASITKETCMASKVMAYRNQQRCQQCIREPSIKLIDFLDKAGSIRSNISLKDKQLVIPFDMINDYSYSELIVTDGNLQSVIPLSFDSKEVLLKDIRLQQSKEKGRICSFERIIVPCKAQEEVTIKEINNTEICFIEDVKELYDTIVLMQKNQVNELKEWAFISTWPKLSTMEKLQKYDKYASNELNLFLHCKDPEFFSSVVRPFIINKKEKQIVDFYLLNDQQSIKKYLSVSQYNGLNKLELVLLAKMAAIIAPEISQAIINLLKAKMLLNAIDLETKNKILDSLFSSRGKKMEEEKPPEPKPKQKIMERRLEAAGESRYMDSRQDEQESFKMKKCSRAMPKGLCVNMMAMPKSCSRAMAMDEPKESFQLDDQEFKKEANVFTPTQGTIEYNEKKYYYGTFDSTIETFWYELACFLIQNQSANNFLPQSFLYAAKNATESIAILSFVNLPFEKQAYVSKVTNNELKIQASNNMYIFYKQIIENEGEFQDMNVLSTQKFFDPDNRFIYDEENPSLQIEKPVNEFIRGKVYGCRLVVTNCTQTPLSLSIIYEIPQGSIPTNSLDTLHVEPVTISSLESCVREFFFYFPLNGTFTIYPATVVKGSKVISFSNVQPKLEVLNEKTIKSLATIQDILATGQIDDIIQFMNTKNILNNKIFNFDQIYWLLKNKVFYEKVIQTMDSKGIFNETVQSFAIFHADYAGFFRLLSYKAHDNSFDQIKYLQCDGLKIDRFELLEYYPLINPRAHCLGSKKENILNNAFKETYKKFLEYLLQKGTPSPEDLIILTNYFIAQDRQEEAVAMLSKINREGLSTNIAKLQYDYLLAYQDFINGYPDFKLAKKICEKYITYPVLTWRNLFVEMANQLSEFEESELIEKTAQQKQEGEVLNKAKAKKLPNFTAELEGSNIKIVAENVYALNVKYFKIDIEVLFSVNPFTFTESQSHAHVMPFFESRLKVNASEDYQVINYPIQENLRNENLFIQIELSENEAKKSQFLSYLPFNLNYHLSEDFGIIKLIDPQTHKPIPKIYVKCFVKYLNGNVKFYKDGYTDIRGSFDYVSLCKDTLNDVSQFSVIVISEQHGCKILKAKAPAKIGRVEGEVKELLSSNWMQKRKLMCEGKSSAQYDTVF